MKKLKMCDALLDETQKFVTWKYCAPIFIAGKFGTAISIPDDLIFKKHVNSSIRSGTVTFISFKEEFFAITCNHVVDILKNKRQERESELANKLGFKTRFEGFHFFTPKNNFQYHFNYEFTAVPASEDGREPDIAIARIDAPVFERLGRDPLILSKRKEALPEIGIACGYPEQQRKTYRGKLTNTLSTTFTALGPAKLQVTANGDLFLQDEIENTEGVNDLSGMSGGPIIWTDENSFGLVGIVRKGKDLEPEEGSIISANSIWIHGDRVTAGLFEKYLESIPEKKALRDQTVKIHVPTTIKKIISGGQIGAGQAGLDVAIDLGISHGGWIPKGRLTEAGILPEKYKLKEMATSSYSKRTEKNILDSDGSVIFTYGQLTGGSALIRKLANHYGFPWLHIDLNNLGVAEASATLSSWIKKHKIKIMNVAGSRASKHPEICQLTKTILTAALAR